MRALRAVPRGFALATAVAALACTYDFERFESAPAASSSGGAAAGSSGSGGSGTGGRAGTGAEASEDEPRASGGAITGEGGAGEGGAGFSCEELDGVVHDGRCYFAIEPEAGLAWVSARDACRTYSSSSHLLTITSSDQQAAVEAAFSPAQSDYWIGLSLAEVEDSPDDDCDDAPESCPFTWVTGDALSYANWAEHSKNDVEPNYTGACVRLQREDFTWADLDCSSRLPALCEHEETKSQGNGKKR